MNAKRHNQDYKITFFSQSARCPVVKQPHLAALYSEVVGGNTVKQNRICKREND